MGTYKIKIAGLERELEMFPVNDKLDIAAFIMFGDVEMTEKTASELLKICPEHDVVVTAEAITERQPRIITRAKATLNIFFMLLYPPNNFVIY